jgi:apolipoprotein N-acyltransferase
MMQLNKKLTSPLLLSLISGILLFAAWPMSPFTFLIFFAFIPLLHIANTPMRNFKFFGLIYIAMLIWNVTTTWWIWYASAPGAIGAFVANSFLMTLPWLLYRMVKRKFSTTISYVALIAFWMLWEYTHLQDWGLSWPWLTVGNVFATQINWIQWYEYTGVSGGTLLVFVINIIVYKKWNQVFNWWKRSALLTQKKLTKVLYLVAILVSSFILYFVFYLINNIVPDDFHGPDSGMLAKNIVICQPNIDPYAKLTTMTPERQLQILLETSKQKVDSNTILLVWPETALYSASRYRENDLFADKTLAPLQQFLQQYPKLQLFTGIESIRSFEQPTTNSQTIPNTNFNYESYNSSVLVDKDGAKQFYHKSMLVPGVETLPSFLNFMGSWFEDLGGTTNGYTKNATRTVVNGNNGIAIAPSICYESIYGEFMSKYVKNGANVITIITNDGWWRNTPGHKQHFAYAKLRAIENRRYVARSANTGISGFIAPNGTTLTSLDYDVNGAVKYTSPNTTGTTFYTKHPDLLYKIAVVLSVLLMFYYNVKIWQKSK